MKNLILVVLATLSLSFAVFAQTNPTTQDKSSTTTETKKKSPIFRANKQQIIQVQKMLKDKGTYTGGEDGKFNDDFRAAIKAFQGDNGLKQTGTLNRATLEKMSIELTDAQKAIPASPNSYATNGEDKSTETKKRGPVFRATKEQIMQAQKMLKDGGMYAGEQTGKLDDDTRTGLKKYQEANGLKVTGTLNQLTLEKMGIMLTDRQKENSSQNN